MTKRYSCRYNIYFDCTSKKIQKTGIVDYDECLKCLGAAIKSIRRDLIDYFFRLDTRIEHLEQFHMPTCDICGRKFRTERGLKMHKTKTHRKQG